MSTAADIRIALDLPDEEAQALALWRHLGEQLGVAAPDLASLRSMYQRRRTLFEHQEED